MGEFSFSDHKYIREFEDALNSISVDVRPASNMAVLSDDFATRKPYWTWLRHKAIGQLKGNPHLIMEFFGLKDIPAPDIFAWYCTIYHSFQFLWSSSSCFSYSNPFFISFAMIFKPEIISMLYQSISISIFLVANFIGSNVSSFSTEK